MQKKTMFIIILFITAMQFISPEANCQSQKRFKKYIPAEGFWILVSNTQVKHATTVQFYNNDKFLVYEEKVVNVNFKLNRAKTLRWLKEGLDKALVAFNQTHQPVKDSTWFSAIVKQ